MILCAGLYLYIHFLTDNSKNDYNGVGLNVAYTVLLFQKEDCYEIIQKET